MNDPADLPSFPDHAGTAGAAARLERAYRRRLACYPRGWRRGNEEEILAVLLACAADGQARPGLAASADLLKGAVRARLRPRPARPATVRAAVRLMCAGAAAELGAVIVIAVTAASVRAAVARHVLGLTAAQWHAVSLHLSIDEFIAPAFAVVWLLLAWANSRGRDWARPLFMAFFALVTAGILIALGEGAAVYAPADLAAGAVLWLVGAAALALIFSPRSGPYYQPGPARRQPVQQ